MATATTIYITPTQRKGLFARARRRKSSFSAELRAAVDFYLELPADFDAKAMDTLAQEASETADRSIRRLDEAILGLKATLKKLDKVDGRLDELDAKRL
jgi:hypothetical protein